MCSTMGTFLVVLWISFLRLVLWGPYLRLFFLWGAYLRLVLLESWAKYIQKVTPEIWSVEWVELSTESYLLPAMELMG
jgi:hypothetical protein